MKAAITRSRKPNGRQNVQRSRHNEINVTVFGGVELYPVWDGNEHLPPKGTIGWSFPSGVLGEMSSKVQEVDYG